MAYSAESEGLLAKFPFKPALCIPMGLGSVYEDVSGRGEGRAEKGSTAGTKWEAEIQHRGEHPSAHQAI